MGCIFIVRLLMKILFVLNVCLELNENIFGMLFVIFEDFVLFIVVYILIF